MKYLFLAIILSFSLGLPAQPLDSFVESLDKSLRSINSRSVELCEQNQPKKTIRSRPTASFQNLEATVLTEKEAQELFNEFKNDSSLAFNFPDAGCWERTYEMSRRLIEKGITPLKSFLNSEGNRGALIRVENPRKKNEILTWNNHVAPVVLVEKNGKIIPYTIDPTLEKAAVPTTEWNKTLVKIKPPGEVRLSYLPANKASPDSLTLLSYKDSEYVKNNLKELGQYFELGNDPEKANEWYFQKYNEELKAGGY